MIKDIVRDVAALQVKSEKASKDEITNIVADLIDTAEHHKDTCAGLSAIQIGYPKRICLIKNNEYWLPIINPLYMKKSKNTILSTEGCMSFDGDRETTRHTSVEVMYTQTNGKIRKQVFGGLQAIIIQHEIDHMNGILI